jgi:PKD repeat protein
MKGRLFILLLFSTFLGGCKKFVDAPKETCFIPYVDFVAYNVNPNTLEVSFSSITSFNGTITSHHWDFGDGSTFNGEIPPPHKYPPQSSSTASNNYRITYTVTNDCGEAYWTDSIKISRCLADVKFTYTLLNDSTVQFTNRTKSATPVSYEWVFGDGTKSTSSANSITKTYTFDGRYTVILKATNACGNNYFIVAIPICARPVPKQTISLSGCATVNINASDTKNGELYQWDFGNGTVLPAAPSSSPAITYTYPKNGSYTVTLKVINKNGCDSATVSEPVTIEAIGVVPNDNWSYTSDDLEFNFSRETVINATAYAWDFGDGTTSSLQNPGKKIFADPGVYTLTLTASNSCGEYSFKTSINVPFYKAVNNTPNVSLREVVAVSANEIYFLTTNGRLYKTDTAGNWSNDISLPPALNFNNNTRLFKDINNDLWIYGRSEVARFNPSSQTWTSLFASTDFDRNTTINGIAIDNNGNLWWEIRK